MNTIINGIKELGNPEVLTMFVQWGGRLLTTALAGVVILSVAALTIRAINCKKRRVKFTTLR